VSREKLHLGLCGGAATLELTYAVVLLPEPEGEFTVEVPSLPGCFSRGKTINEALRNGEEAILCHLESFVERGEVVPQEGTTITLDVSDLTEALVFRLSVGLEAEQVA